MCLIHILFLVPGHYPCYNPRTLCVSSISCLQYQGHFPCYKPRSLCVFHPYPVSSTRDTPHATNLAVCVCLIHILSLVPEKLPCYNPRSLCVFHPYPVYITRDTSHATNLAVFVCFILILFLAPGHYPCYNPRSLCVSHPYPVCSTRALHMLQSSQPVCLIHILSTVPGTLPMLQTSQPVCVSSTSYLSGTSDNFHPSPHAASMPQGSFLCNIYWSIFLQKENRRLENKADRPIATSDEVLNAWNVTFPPPYVFKV